MTTTSPFSETGPIISPEWLMAYADGETTAEVSSLIERALQTDAASRTVAARFMADGPLLRGEVSFPVTAHSGPKPPTRAKFRWSGGMTGTSFVSMAAGFALIAATGIAAFGIGMMAGERSNGEASIRTASTASERQLHSLAGALEALPNHQIAEWSDVDTGLAGHFVPIATFVDTTGRFCRTVQQSITANGAAATGAATACRELEGGWRMVNWSLSGSGSVAPLLPILDPPPSI